MTDIVGQLRRACGYVNINDEVRGYQSSASNGLVLDAADEIERLQARCEACHREAEAFADIITQIREILR
jgi:thymidine kinase